MKKINIHPLTKPRDLTPPDGKTIYVVTEEHCVRSERENKPYGSWEEQYDSSLEYITKNKPDTWNFSAMVVDSETYNAEKIYAIAVTYGTGDTFGHATGKLCIYKVMADKEKAREIAADIQKNGKNFSHDKDEFPTFCGYFESVENVELYEMEYE